MGTLLKTTPHWKVKTPSRKCFLEKKEKSETVINTFVSVKTKMAEISQERDFLTCSIKILWKKGKQFVRKYHIMCD